MGINAASMMQPLAYRLINLIAESQWQSIQCDCSCWVYMGTQIYI